MSSQMNIMEIVYPEVLPTLFITGVQYIENVGKKRRKKKTLHWPY